MKPYITSVSIEGWSEFLLVDLCLDPRSIKAFTDEVGVVWLTKAWLKPDRQLAIVERLEKCGYIETVILKPGQGVPRYVSSTAYYRSHPTS